MSSRRTQMWQLAIASVALFCSFGFAAQQQSEVVSTRNIYVDLVVPENAPRTLRDRLLQVDAAIRCRVERSASHSVVRDVPPGVDPSIGTEPVTENVVTVLEIVKTSARLPSVGRTTTVLQQIGSIVVDGVRIVKHNGGFKAFKPGEEYVLFLNWNASDGAFEVVNDADAFLITGGVIVASPHWPHSRGEQGRDATQFMTSVRSAAAGSVR